MTRNMIFHAPFALEENASSASGIRPVQMRNAFEKMGYEVTTVTGSSGERAKAMRRVRADMAAGKVFDFCYSESSTMPMTMTDPSHLPLHPLLDSHFFRDIRRSNVRVGHFLRDIFWAFPEYRQRTRFPKREIALLGYRWDLRTYRRYVDLIYLPSMAMADHLTLPIDSISELPPGHGWEAPVSGPDKGLRLFYVGGLTAHYNLHRFLEGVQLARSQGADVEATLCTPGELWGQAESEYRQYVQSGGIKVVEARGDDLRPHYERANLGVLLVSPDDYWTIANPVKLYDYLGAGKAVLASDQTLAGSLVTSEGIGWSLPYDATAIAAWLVEASSDPSVLEAKRAPIAASRGRHTWLARAQKVASDLSPK